MALPVLATIIDQVEPPLVDLSIMYPVIEEPPLSVGAVQERLICDDEIAVAASPLGEDGTTLKVVAEAVLEGELVPTRFFDDTLYVYIVLCASPPSEYVVAVEPVFPTKVDQVEPPLVDLSILYPVSNKSEGAVQLRVILELEIACAVRFVGGCGRIPIWAFAY